MKLKNELKQLLLSPKMPPLNCPFCNNLLQIIHYQNDNCYACNNHKHQYEDMRGYYKYCYYLNKQNIVNYFWCIIDNYAMRVYFDRPSFELIDYKKKDINIAEESVIFTGSKFDIDISSPADIERVIKLLLKFASFA